MGTDLLAAPTPDEVVETTAEWAKCYPCARFLVVRVDHEDTWNSTILGWGLAFPDRVVFDQPEVRCSSRARAVDDVLAGLRLTGDVQVIWIDPEPERWPEDDPDVTDHPRTECRQ